jgi:hypothetical protein
MNSLFPYTENCLQVERLMLEFITTTAVWNLDIVDLYTGTGVSVSHIASPILKLEQYIGRQTA